MSSTLRHIALVVPDLQAAEAFNRPLFGMELIGREAEGAGALWYTLPFDKGWDDARRAGIRIGMLALRKGEIVLALFAGDAAPGQVFAIGLGMAEDEIAGVRSRLPAGAEVMTDAPDRLEFRDPYGITWQIALPGSAFQTAGDFAGRWIEM